MKTSIRALLLILSILLSGCNIEAPIIPTDPPSSGNQCSQHVDANEDTVCDVCANSVFVYFDFYNINDLHGKLDDADTHPGVDELSTYLKNCQANDQNAIFLSSGDMWQGSAESNMTTGLIMTDWMNQMGFTAMALGNHEFDWGEDAIEKNHEMAEFPFLAINIYDRETNQLVDYCTPSVMVEGDGLQIGIIGAIGDCYSSISSDKTQDIYFKTGKDLTNLVKTESERLRNEGADYIVYILHDGYENSRTGTPASVSKSDLSYYYDTTLSNGYIDLVFEGHTHQGYRLIDEYGVYHLQNRGDNKGGICHVEVAINSVDYTSSVRVAELVSTDSYKNLEDDPLVNQLLDKYADDIAKASKVVGYNRTRLSSNELRQIIADLYYQAGVDKWGDKYNIVLGGGFLSVRSPNYLASGEVTYGMLQSLFPFNNELMLCSIKGRDLWNKFFKTDNSNYFISYGDYGQSVYNKIDMNATYYIVVDSYSAYYSPNKLTIVAEFGADIYARDLLADYITAGGLD